MDKRTFRTGQLLIDSPFQVEGTRYAPVGFEDGHPREQYTLGVETLNPPKQTVTQFDVRFGVRRRLKAKVGDYKPAYGAQIFVGLSVDGQKAWTADQVRDWVMEWREEQLERMEAGWVARYQRELERCLRNVGPDGTCVTKEMRELWDRGASVIPMLGYWKKVGKSAYPEESASVTVLNLAGESEEEFKKNMKEIAADAVTNFYQDSVILQFTDGNVVKEVLDFQGE